MYDLFGIIRSAQLGDYNKYARFEVCLVLEPIFFLNNIY